ncbi:MAG: DUF1003 domain-containing protein [Candidatus Hydrogenedentes bacterium]|nr:DUF1003 domain-containing protein [Candidatus Hydrogenedentota bacterium]
MNDILKHAASRLLNVGLEELSSLERNVVSRLVERKPISRNTTAEFGEQLTLGQRIADQVAAIGGSWSFIIGFAVVMTSWIALNSFILVKSGEDFDPYPYILLNLVLSMLAAIQAPLIMMSQNRHAAKDRMDAMHDYEVNLKAELEILELHRKIDEMREQQWKELLALQQEQIRLLTEIVQSRQA